MGWTKKLVSKGFDWTRLNGNPTFFRKQQPPNTKKPERKAGIFDATPPRRVIMPLTKEEKRVCELTGTNPHAYIEARELDHAEALNREAPISKEDEMKICAMLGTTPEEVAKCNP